MNKPTLNDVSAVLVHDAGRSASLESSPPSGFSSNEITGLAIGESSDRQSRVVVLSLFDFDLTFQTDRAIVFILADSFSKMLAELRELFGRPPQSSRR